MDDLLNDISIELHVPDFQKVKDFYGSIGYKIVWERLPNIDKGYLVMRNGRSILNFYCGNEEVYNHSYFKHFPKKSPRGYGVEIIIPIDDIEEFYTSFKNQHPNSIVSDLSQKHSHKDFRAIDPFGYYLRFVERYNWVEGRDEKGDPVSE